MSSSTSSSVVRTFARRKRAVLATLAASSLALLAIPAGASAGGVCAESTTWTGATNTDWDTNTNWTNGQPTAADDAIINNTSTNNPTVSTAGEVACEVHLTGNKQLNVTGGSLNVTPGSASDLIDVDAGSNVNVTGGELTFGSLVVDNTSGLTLAGGAIAGTLNATTPLTLTNAGATYGTAVSVSNGVTLGSNVNLTQTNSPTMTDSHFLSIPSTTFTLPDAAKIFATGTPLVMVGPSVGTPNGTLRATGISGGGSASQVRARLDLNGTLLADDAALGIQGAGNANTLRGNLTTTGFGTMRLGGDNTYTLDGPLTVNNPSGSVALNQASPPAQSQTLNLNGQTVSLNGDFRCGSTGTVSGTGTFDAVSPNFGELSIEGCNLSSTANVTITADTTARVAQNTDWTNNSTFNVNGTMVLDGTSLTASDNADTPTVNISSTGLLTHIGSNFATFQPRIVSTNGTIEDASSGVLDIERPAVIAQTNLYSGSMQTFGGDADLELGSEVHRLQGSLTMDTTNGGEIKTEDNPDLQLNSQTLTLLGTSLSHEGGTISGTGTINGPGTLYVRGGDFAGGGTMNVNAPTEQTSATNVGGFGSELRIGGDWLSNANITSTDTATVRVVSGGVLRHDSGTSNVSAPLTIDNGATVNVNAGQLQLSDLTNYNGGTDTLTGGAYNIAGGGVSLCIDGPLNTLAASLSINSNSSLLFAPAGCTTNAITDELSTIASGGTFSLQSGHTADIDSPLTVNSGGLLAGNGTIVGDVVNNGDVGPGLSVGQLDIDGNYTQNSGGDLNIEVEGTDVDEFDILDVDGDVTINDGELAMMPIGNFPAQAKGGDRVAFLRFTGTRSGEFSPVTTSPGLDLGQPFFADYDDPGARVFAVVGNTFKEGSNFIARRNRANGTATLIVKVTGSGTVRIKGPEIKTKSRDADGPGKVNLPVKTQKGSDARKELNRDGETTVKVKVRYSPDIGNPSKTTIFVDLIKKD